MVNRRLSAVVLSAAFLFGCMPAEASPLSDSQIRQRIIGSWTVALDSADYQAGTPYGVETFNADGTYLTTWYQNADCKVRLRQIASDWSIKGGVLLSDYRDGSGSKDQIVDISAKTMTFYSLDDGAVYSRTKIEPCGTPTS